MFPLIRRIPLSFKQRGFFPRWGRGFQRCAFGTREMEGAGSGSSSWPWRPSQALPDWKGWPPPNSEKKQLSPVARRRLSPVSVPFPCRSGMGNASGVSGTKRLHFRQVSPIRMTSHGRPVSSGVPGTVGNGPVPMQRVFSCGVTGHSGVWAVALSSNSTFSGFSFDIPLPSTVPISQVAKLRQSGM